MVLYESVGKTIYLNYEGTVPSANQVVNDAINAPIERGISFQNRKCKTNEKVLIVKAKLGEKALKEVVEGLKSWGFSRIEDDETIAFSIPEEEVSNQGKFI